MEELNGANFLPDEIRNEQDDDEDVNEQIVVTKAAQPSVPRGETGMTLAEMRRAPGCGSVQRSTLRSATGGRAKK
jgi:hypothetical protein